MKSSRRNEAHRIKETVKLQSEIKETKLWIKIVNHGIVLTVLQWIKRHTKYRPDGLVQFFMKPRQISMLCPFQKSKKNRTEERGKNWSNACKRKVNAIRRFAYLSRCQNRWQRRPNQRTRSQSSGVATHRSFYALYTTLARRRRKKNNRVGSSAGIEY